MPEQVVTHWLPESPVEWIQPYNPGLDQISLDLVMQMRGNL